MYKYMIFFSSADPLANVEEDGTEQEEKIQTLIDNE